MNAVAITESTHVGGVHSPAADPTRPHQDRHTWLDRICGWLARIDAGRHARTLLAEGTIPAAGAVVVLPAWAWAHPKVDVGRKGRGYDGSVLRLPVRLDYTCGPVVLHARGTSTVISWSGLGLGREDTGTITITDQPGQVEADRLRDWDGQLPTHVTAGPESANRIRITLNHLITDGDNARWELLHHLESTYIHRVMAAAAGKVLAEVGDGAQSGVDAVTVETLVTGFTFGNPGEGPSRMTQIIEAALVPSRFRKVDPGRWLVVEVQRSCERYVRKYLGDPRIGSKIRRLLRELPDSPESIQELVEAYARRHPEDRLAAPRAIQALTTTGSALLCADELPEADR